MKIKSFLTGMIALCLLASPVFGANGNARIDISVSKGELKYEKSSVKGGSISHPGWVKDEAARMRQVTTNLPVNDQKWTQVTIEVTPTEDCTANVALRGQWLKTQMQWIYCDDIAIEGMEVKNPGFEEADGWKIAKEQLLSDESLAHTGKGLVKVWHDKAANQSFKLKAGEPIKITAWLKFDQLEDKPAKK